LDDNYVIIKEIFMTKNANVDEVKKNTSIEKKLGLVCVFDSTKNSNKKGAHTVGCKN
jgi:hypothetical protein